MSRLKLLLGAHLSLLRVALGGGDGVVGGTPIGRKAGDRVPPEDPSIRPAIALLVAAEAAAARPGLPGRRVRVAVPIAVLRDQAGGVVAGGMR